jgi:hypothetical protein
VTDAVTAGWNAAELAAFVGANSAGVRSPYAVLAARLSTLELPAPCPSATRRLALVRSVRFSDPVLARRAWVPQRLTLPRLRRSLGIPGRISSGRELSKKECRTILQKIKFEFYNNS